MNNTDYYKILEINEDASVEVVKAAYRALARKYHPDNYSGSDSDRIKSMADINEAYKVLSDDNERKKYDAKRKVHYGEKNANRTSPEKETASGKSMDRHNEQPSDREYTTNCANNESFDADFNFNTDSEQTQRDGIFGRVVRNIGREVISTMQKNSRDMENAYLEGMVLDEYALVRKFKLAKGIKRAGYAKAMEEKELLVRNEEGKLIPSYKYRNQHF